MTDKSKIEELTDADLDGVQGGAGKFEQRRAGSGASQVKQVGGKGVVLSSETETTYLKDSKETNKGIVVSSEGENPN